MNLGDGGCSERDRAIALQPGQQELNSVSKKKNLKKKFSAFCALLFFSSYELSYLIECVYHLNMSTTLELHEIKDKIICYTIVCIIYQISFFPWRHLWILCSILSIPRFVLLLIVLLFAEMNFKIMTLSCDIIIQLQKYQLP